MPILIPIMSILALKSQSLRQTTMSHRKQCGCVSKIHMKSLSISGQPRGLCQMLPTSFSISPWICVESEWLIAMTLACWHFVTLVLLHSMFGFYATLYYAHSWKSLPCTRPTKVYRVILFPWCMIPIFCILYDAGQCLAVSSHYSRIVSMSGYLLCDHDHFDHNHDF